MAWSIFRRALLSELCVSVVVDGIVPVNTAKAAALWRLMGTLAPDHRVWLVRVVRSWKLATRRQRPSLPRMETFTKEAGIVLETTSLVDRGLYLVLVIANVVVAHAVPFRTWLQLKTFEPLPALIAFSIWAARYLAYATVEVREVR